jgi:hypothetical protein
MRNLWNIWWNPWTLWPKLISVGIVAVLLIVLVGGLRSCLSKSRTAKVDLETVDKINSKNANEARSDINKMVEENLDVVRTADNRTTLVEANAVERDRLIAEKKAVVNREVEKARAIDGNVTQEELQCILVPSDCS